MKIAILGSSGFLGSIISNYFIAQQYEVFNVNRQALNLLSFIDVKNWLNINKPDVIINCATAGGKQKLKDISYVDIQNNLGIFLNFYNNSHLFKKFINVGSGSEFDISTNINKVEEDNILNVVPKESYGYSKNVISRLVLEKENFLTLRLFGCFDYSEQEFRLFKKILNSNTIDIEDREFDFFSAQDFCRVLDHCVNNDIKFKDVNCVYSEKNRLSNIVKKLIEFHKIKCTINIVKQSNLNYTGSFSRMEYLNLKLLGLDESLKLYKD